MKKDLRMVPCPHCGKQISPAQILGAMAAGKKKNYSADELARRSARLPRPHLPVWIADGKGNVHCSICRKEPGDDLHVHLTSFSSQS